MRHDPRSGGRNASLLGTAVGSILLLFGCPCSICGKPSQNDGLVRSDPRFGDGHHGCHELPSVQLSCSRKRFRGGTRFDPRIADRDHFDARRDHFDDTTLDNRDRCTSTFQVPYGEGSSLLGERGKGRLRRNHLGARCSTVVMDAPRRDHFGTRRTVVPSHLSSRGVV